MHCAYHDAALCGSCTLLPVPYDAQLAAKHERAVEALAAHPGVTWLPPVPSAERGFRTKAKLVVGGTVDRPTLGILDGSGRGVDLRDCALHAPDLHAALPTLASFVTRAGLVPYDVPSRTGELKHVIVTTAPDGRLMVRFVLRSTEALARVRKHLPWLLGELPTVAVASINLQPAHAAVLEGDREVPLTPAQHLPVDLGGVTLQISPGSFVQTNTAVAQALYRQAAAWVDELEPASLWDLYCGVGGFALHCAAPGRDVRGIEVTAAAVASASAAAARAGLSGVRFDVGDATEVAAAASDLPEVVVVNPPRRGLGPRLTAWLASSGVPHVLYSSCHLESLVRDLEALRPLRPVRARVFDMFPHTQHQEVLVLLSRDAEL